MQGSLETQISNELFHKCTQVGFKITYIEHSTKEYFLLTLSYAVVCNQIL